MRICHAAFFALLTGTGLLCAQTPSVATGGVLNGASYERGQAVAPGSLVSIFGSDLASSTVLYDSLPLSTSLGDVSVRFGDVAVPLTLVTGSQINAQVPWSASGNTAVVVSRGGRQSTPIQFEVAPTAPGIFSIPAGEGQAIAINSDGTIAGPAGIIPGLTTRPARIADPGGVVIYATGLGAVDSPIADGAISLDKLRNTLAQPTVLIGGSPVQVVFSGLTPQFPGVNQVNIFIPDGTPVGNNQPLQIRMGGITTTSKVLISVTR